MKTKFARYALVAGAFALAFIPLLLLIGCSTSPNASERFLFTAQTNSVPVVTNWTVTDLVTNAAGNFETVHTVKWLTNIQSIVTWQVSTNAAAIIQTGGRIGDIFSPGLGSLVSTGALGLLALFAKLRGNKINAGAEVLAQSVETLLAIIETTKGKQFADSIKLRLVKDQNAAGVIREIGLLVEKSVDNEQAKALAKVLLDSLPAQPAT